MNPKVEYSCLPCWWNWHYQWHPLKYWVPTIYPGTPDYQNVPHAQFVIYTGSKFYQGYAHWWSSCAGLVTSSLLMIKSPLGLAKCLRVSFVAPRVFTINYLLVNSMLSYLHRYHSNSDCALSTRVLGCAMWCQMPMHLQLHQFLCYLRIYMIFSSKLYFQ